MTVTQYNNLKCGNLVSDERGIVYVITQRLTSNDTTSYMGVTLDNNTFNSKRIHKGICFDWHIIGD